MPTFYLQEGLRPLSGSSRSGAERNTHNNEPGVFLDDRLHKGNVQLDTYEAEDWIHAREQIADWAYPSYYPDPKPVR